MEPTIDIFTEVRWIFSGIGVLALVTLLPLLRRNDGEQPRDLAALVTQVNRSTLAIEQTRALQAMVGITVRFEGRVDQATASTDDRFVTVDFEAERGILVGCVFDRQRFPATALLKVGDELQIVGTIVRATRETIEVRPSAWKQ